MADGDAVIGKAFIRRAGSVVTMSKQRAGRRPAELRDIGIEVRHAV
jgi:hypothetical protein